MSPKSKGAGIAVDVQQYLSLPYTRELVREDDGSWFARILEFPGCMTVGDTREEALQMLDDAMATWLAAKLQDREAIPAPMVADAFSGRFVVRVTKSLHRDLVRAAERDGVSLNHYVATMLAQSAGAGSHATPRLSPLVIPEGSGISRRRQKRR
jgi:antitoxin HicB